jgi:hypothetical protein
VPLSSLAITESSSRSDVTVPAAAGFPSLPRAGRGIHVGPLPVTVNSDRPALEVDT